MTETTKTQSNNQLNILRILLDGDAPDVRTQRETKVYEVRRLSKALGRPVCFTLRGLPYGRVQELQRLQEDVPCHIVLEGCVDPSFRDPELLAKYRATTPLDAIQALLLPGEIEDLSRAVERLTGFRQNTIREIKNG